MIYIKLEENMDKFFIINAPKFFKKILFVIYKKIGKIKIKKIENFECIILPEINEKILKKLTKISKIKCFTNICVSNNLAKNENFKNFILKNNFNLLNGKWLFKNILYKIIEYIVDIKNEKIEAQEITILCNNLDETILEQIKDISQKAKIFNILTNNINQFEKLETQILEEFGIIINISNNYKKLAIKSGIVINYDFNENELNKCIFSKNKYLINLNDKLKISDFQGRCIIDYDIYMPQKYIDLQNQIEGFENNILYESFIYMRTSYKNIKKKINEDNIQIFYLKDSNEKIIKKHQK